METGQILPRLKATRGCVLEHFDLDPLLHGRSYAPGKWTIGRILAHLADAEIANYWRFLRAIAEPGCSVEPYDQDQWAKAMDYDKRPLALSRGLFASARDMLIHYVGSLAPAQLEQGFALHSEKGRLSGWEWADNTCAHTEHHVGQLQAARDGTPWRPVITPDSWRHTGQPNPAHGEATE